MVAAPEADAHAGLARPDLLDRTPDGVGGSGRRWDSSTPTAITPATKMADPIIRRAQEPRPGPRVR
jgi:hypothetical protein